MAPERASGPRQGGPAPAGGGAEPGSVEVLLEPADLPADAVEVGRIADAWGVKGWFKVLPHSPRPEVLFSARRWYLQPPEQGSRAFSHTLLLRVKEVKEHSDTVVVHAHDIHDRDHAHALKGARVFVPRSMFPTAEEDEYYWVDLIGLDVVNRQGVPLGRVKDLMATGPQSVLVLEYEEGGSARERMVPFVNAYVDKVDLQGRVITVDWQADY